VACGDSFCRLTLTHPGLRAFVQTEPALLPPPTSVLDTSELQELPLDQTRHQAAPTGRQEVISKNDDQAVDLWVIFQGLCVSQFFGSHGSRYAAVGCVGTSSFEPWATGTVGHKHRHYHLLHRCACHRPMMRVDTHARQAPPSSTQPMLLSPPHSTQLTTLNKGRTVWEQGCLA